MHIIIMECGIVDYWTALFCHKNEQYWTALFCHKNEQWYIDNKVSALFAQDSTGFETVIKNNNARTDWQYISLRMRR